MQKVLLAGITGYLGRYIAKESQARRFTVRAIARNTALLHEKGILPHELIQAELTDPETITGCCGTSMWSSRLSESRGKRRPDIHGCRFSGQYEPAGGGEG